MSWTKKEDVKLVLLYDDGQGEYDYPVTLLVSNRDIESNHNIHNDKLMFLNEFDELDIRFDFDEWISYRYSDREDLKKELEKRGFLVEIK